MAKSSKSLKAVSKVFHVALAIIFGFLVVFSTVPVWAAHYDLACPSDSANPVMTIAQGEFVFGGDASMQDGYIRLTRDEQSLFGSAFSTNTVTMPDNFAFNAYFTFQIIPSSSRADGMAFAIQTTTNAAGTGGYLGVLGTYPMFAIEFDTFKNTDFGDPSNNHIAIIHGISPNGIGNVDHNQAGQGIPVALDETTQVDLADGVVHHCWVEYDGSNVHVRIGNTNDRSAAVEYLNQAYNIANLFTSPHVHFGFGAGTGGESEEHRVLDAVFTPVVRIIPAQRHVSPTLPQLKPAQISVVYLSVNPQQASANQPVTITTNVANTGDQAGSLNVALKINEQVEQTRMVSVGPQVAQPIKFTVTKAQPGTYEVNIGGQRGSFTILGASSSTAGTHASVGLIAILVTCLLIIVTIVMLMLTFRRTA